jgi:hypothetical protein
MSDKVPTGYNSLQELTTQPVVSYKDQKLMLAVYRGELRKPGKLNRLISRGLVYVKDEDGSIGFTVKGAMVLSHYLELKVKKHATSKRKTIRTAERVGAAANE